MANKQMRTTILNKYKKDLISLPAYEESKNTRTMFSRTSSKPYSLEDACIIGITGVQGKTSTAYLVHQYLKSLGKKSILFSSCLIDSPAGRHPVDNGMEMTFGGEISIAAVLNEAVAYEAEYIILECWSESLGAGVFDNIPFDIKAMSMFYSLNGNHTDADTVWQKKLRFFKNEEDAICIFNIEDIEGYKFAQDAQVKNQVLLDTRLDRSTHTEQETTLYKTLNIPYSFKSTNSDLTAQTAVLNLNSEELPIQTSLFSPVHLKNILVAAAILSEAGELDVDVFTEFVADPSLKIPGRMETIQWKDRLIVLDASMADPLYWATTIGAGHTVSAVHGYRLTNHRYNKNYRNAHPDYNWNYDFDLAPSVVSKYADKVYITVDDYCDLTEEEIVNQYAQRTTIQYEVEPNRKLAIKRALEKSNPGDIICVIGRGSRKLRWLSYFQLSEFSDYKAILEAIEELDS